MNRNPLVISACLALVASLSFGNPLRAEGPAAFYPIIPVFNGGDSANGLSSDGSTVVGYHWDGAGTEAFVWTKANPVRIGLGRPQSESSESWSNAVGVSADGSVVVGHQDSPDSGREAWVWTRATNTRMPLSRPEGGAASAAGTTADGSVIAGSQYDPQTGSDEACLWSSEGRLGLGSPADPLSSFSYSVGISANGSTVIGNQISSLAGFEAWVWTPETQTRTALKTPGASSSLATGVSADGSTVIVNQWTGTENQALVWRREGPLAGMRLLPGLADNAASASAVSADGSVIVGFSFDLNGRSVAVRWINGAIEYLGGLGEGHSMATCVSADGGRIAGRGWNDAGEFCTLVWDLDGTPSRLSDRLAAQGVSVDTNVWGLESAVRISADGTTILGADSATNRAWLAVLPIGEAVATPEEMIGRLAADVTSLSVAQGVKASLGAHLDAALASLEGTNADRRRDAVKKLEAFVTTVKALRGKKIPGTEADRLISAADSILQAISP